MKGRIWPIIPGLAAVAAVAAGVAVGAVLFHSTGGGRVLRGVRIAGIPVAGLTRRETAAFVARLEQDVFRRPVTISGPSRAWTLRPREVGLRLDHQVTAARAFAVGREEPFPERLLVWHRLLSQGVNVEPVIEYDQLRLREIALEWSDYFRRPPRNAHLDARSGKVTAEEAGSEVDFSRTLEAVRAALRSAERRTVTLPVRVVRPRVTLARLASIGAREVLGTFSTSFDSSDRNRTHNIRLAASAIDGLILGPGEVFSFNGVVGPRTPERGYKSAPEIIEERFVTGIGGGVCQVSSTLYNAILLAGLAVVERTNHSQPLRYVQLGRDATVYYGLIDFKFRNNQNWPVVVTTEVRPGSLSVAVCGQNEDLPEVRVQVGAIEPVEPAELIEVDPALPPGARVQVQEPRMGYHAEVSRVFYRNGREVGREPISRDFYKPRPRKLKVGPPVDADPSQDPDRDEPHGR